MALEFAKSGKQPSQIERTLDRKTKGSASNSDTKFSMTFRALRYPSYRYLWLGQLGHSAAMWMEQVARPLLVLELTGSAFQVGLVISLRMLPQLVFGLLAGVIADRYSKRLILMISQSVTMLMNLTLALLLLTGHLALWHVYATAVVSGASMAFNQPARQSLVPRLVPREVMLNAVSLNTAAMNIMRVLGAALAGVLLIFFDYGQVYMLNAVLFIGVIWATFKIKFSESPADKILNKPKVETTLWRDFADGFRYVSRNPELFYLVGLGLVLFIFGQTYQQVFIPILALDVLDVGRSGAGWMLAFTGVGALIGSLTMASQKQLPRRGLVLMALLLILSFSLALLAQSHWYPLSIVALVMAGGMGTAYMALNTSLLLEKSSMEYHGRVMCLMSLDRGLVSVGALLAGGLAERLGPQTGLTVLAAICATLTLLAFLFVRPIRKIV